jgi:hypothetical protein
VHDVKCLVYICFFSPMENCGCYQFLKGIHYL